MDDNQPRTITWNFEPFMAPRANDAGEIVYTKRWQKLMGGTEVTHDLWFVENEPQEFPILSVFKDFAMPNARDTRVASSVIKWLGTNDGRVFLSYVNGLAPAMEQAKARHYSLSDTFAAVWCIDTKRNHSANGGRVRRDWMISPETPTTRDYEVMEITCRWLGSREGQAFIEGAQRNLKIKQARADALVSARRLTI